MLDVFILTIVGPRGVHPMIVVNSFYVEIVSVF